MSIEDANTTIDQLAEQESITLPEMQDVLNKLKAALLVIEVIQADFEQRISDLET